KIKGRTYLVAAVVAESEDKLPEISELIKTAEESLPEYMIPSVIFNVKNMPLTANGKIDRKILTKLGEEAVQNHKHSEKSVEMSDTERLIAEIWMELLGLEELPNVCEDFFDYGGDSLDIVKLRTKLVEKFGKEIEITDIFADPTVSGIASLL
ncbi:MAG: hypothetical protein IJA12_04605, partial [Oscillospiraceae bacterium]|nr:hypothetical protein [Oscillospiraceae bacterium]